MNKEYGKDLLNGYVNLMEKGYCDDCNNLNCIGNFPHKDIAKEIVELQKQQLTKEEKKLIIEALNLLEKYYTYHKSQTYMESIKYKVDNLINKLGG